MTEKASQNTSRENVENTTENANASANDAQNASEETLEQVIKEAEDTFEMPEPEVRIKELEDKLLRTMAEMENLRRRTEKELEETRKYAVTGFARDLISVLENLERAEQSIPADADESVQKIGEGVKLTAQELLKVFENYGIQRISPEGQPFDHNYHQAIVEIPTADHAPGTVVNVMQSGFTIKDRLLRPAMVGVAKAVPEGE